ncbi:hypothetical protein M4E85_000101 [Salmonella enterica]|nr:hypothetical protein [Salmonella enterica]
MKEDAIKVFSSFAKEMNKWEISYHTALRGDRRADKEPYREKLNAIFEKYCTKKERKYGRQTAMDVCFPPDYDLDNDEILDIEINKNKAIITVQKHTGFKDKFRYTLHFKNNEWRIDKRERFSSGENKWVKYGL